MRLWSLHPRYLDTQGLLAVWREALLARAVLAGRTRGYRAHPQLHRFRRQAVPMVAINIYLTGIFVEATKRGFRFDRRKLSAVSSSLRITVTTGQLDYEWKHLLAKLRRRDAVAYSRARRMGPPRPHPLFRTRPGAIASWERISGD